MPKISDAKRAGRREAILQAARACFERNGLHATTMDDIIQRSGLSAGAIYGYFATKDELILAALTSSMASLGMALAPLFAPAKTLPPVDFIREFTATIDRFTKQDGLDRTRIAMHGWSEQQRNEAVRVTMQGIYQGLRRQLQGVAERWQEKEIISGHADAKDIASLLFSLALGFVAQSAILGDAEPEPHARALAALINVGTEQKRAES
jgi:AcrR family transcriptional regulator